MKEVFQIPGVGAIIERETAGGIEILVQDRCKLDSPTESGLIEIPAGKIRQFESLFDTLRREVGEETGLEVEYIPAQEHSEVLIAEDYQVLSCEPFCVSQNLAGSYPILVMTFLCRARGELLPASNESQNIRWVALADLASLLATQPKAFYPMHIYALKKYCRLKGNIEF